MEKASIEELGLSEDMSWESEQQERKSVFDKIQRLKRGAYDKAMDRRKEELGGKPPQEFNINPDKE